MLSGRCLPVFGGTLINSFDTTVPDIPDDDNILLKLKLTKNFLNKVYY
jgi:hypothetical protein